MRDTRIHLRVAPFAVALMLFVLIVGLAAAATPAKVCRIKLTTTDPATTIWMQEIQEAIGRIKERSGGGLEVQLHPNGEMLVYDEGIEAVMSDTAVIYFTDPSLFADYAPAYATLCAPYRYSKFEEVEQLMETDLYKRINAEAEAAGLHSITNSFVVGVRNILASIPVTSIEDCRKLKIRIPNSSIYVQTFDALGCNYQALPFNEVYSALETGMLNSVEITPGNLVTLAPQKSMKGEKYYSLEKHMLNVVGLQCGQGFWESLPEEYRAILEEEFRQAMRNSNRKVAASDDAIIAALDKEGIVVVEVPNLSGFKEAVKPFCEKLPMFAEISAAVAALGK